MYEDGLATVGRLGIGGGDNSVECTEAFQDAPVCSDNPLKNPDACITGAGTFTDLADSSEAPAQAEPGFDLGLPLASSAKADETAPFHVDVDRILEIATAAVYERYPELPPDDLDSGQGLFVLCPATPSPEPAAEAAPFSCFAQISSFLKSTVVEGAYAGFDGNCETAKRGEQVQVQVTESGRVHVSRGQGVECTKAFAE